jgi:biotin carboxyl carrier protein
LFEKVRACEMCLSTSSALCFAMKMVATVSASTDGTIKEVLVKKGEQVDSDDLLVRIDPA